MTFKQQDWANHLINFILIFVSVAVGITATSFFEKKKAKNDAIHLLREMYADLQKDKCVIEGVKKYYSVSKDASAHVISQWDVPSDISDRQFINELIKASQIITPPTTLSMYEPLFGKDELRLLNNSLADEDELTGVRKELIRFFSYDTDVFKYEALLSPYRTEIRKFIPYEVQTSYCKDENDTKYGSGVQHGSNCELVQYDDFTSLAKSIRENSEIFENLTYYNSELIIRLKHLSDYHSNMLAIERVIYASHPDFKKPKKCKANPATVSH